MDDSCDKPKARRSSFEGFDKLPYEILMLIFDYLDPYFLSRTVTRVCTRFAGILHDEFLWKKRLAQYINKHLGTYKRPIKNPYNIGMNEGRWTSGREVCWRDLAVNYNLTDLKWVQHRSAIRTQIFNVPHFTAVDTVKIIANGEAVVSGGRDRMVNLWKINTETLDLEGIFSADRCHSGWVWDIDSCEPDSFFTCSWDTNVVHWVAEGLTRISTYDCGNPVMAISSTRGLVAAGLHTPRIVLIDPRIGFIQDIIPVENSVCFSLHNHTVTDVMLLPERNLLLSVSEDRTLCFFDTRFHKKCYQTITISQNKSFPKCLGRHKELIYVGDSKGNVHINTLGTSSSESQVINVGSSRLITGIVPHLGGALVGSLDRHVRILYPSDPPIILWDQTLAGEVTAVDQYKDLVAVSSAVGSINLYKPLGF